jgi:hypothetical protein
VVTAVKEPMTQMGISSVVSRISIIDTLSACMLSVRPIESSQPMAVSKWNPPSLQPSPNWNAATRLARKAARVVKVAVQRARWAGRNTTGSTPSSGIRIRMIGVMDMDQPCPPASPSAASNSGM